MPYLYNSWLEPYCADVPPPGKFRLEFQAAWMSFVCLQIVCLQRNNNFRRFKDSCVPFCQCVALHLDRCSTVPLCPSQDAEYPLCHTALDQTLASTLPTLLLAGNSTCAEIKASGSCNAEEVINPYNPHAASLQGYCDVSCERCSSGAFYCVDREVPSGLSGGCESGLRER